MKRKSFYTVAMIISILLASTPVWAQESTNRNMSPTYTLSISAVNGTVTKSPNKASFSSGETVTLIAVPNVGYAFGGWSGSATGSASVITITMNSNKVVTANFAAITLIDIGDDTAGLIPTQPEPQIQVFFSPKGGCTDAIVKALGKAKTTILIQAYSFTSAPIAKAAVDAHKRGVKVKVILDKSQRTEKYSSADFLAHAQVTVSIDAKHKIAHNKVMIIDSETVITGSFNFSKSAEEENAENLLIIHNSDLAEKYVENWNKHAEHSEEYKGKGMDTPSLQNPKEIKTLLQGKWINNDKNWGIVFKDDMVSEYEDGRIQNGECKYILDITANPIEMTILDPRESITYRIEFQNDQTLFIQEVNLEESTFLTKTDY